MPLKLSKTGARVLDAKGQLEKRLKSRRQARAYMTARNLSWMRSKGRKVPKRR